MKATVTAILAATLVAIIVAITKLVPASNVTPNLFSNPAPSIEQMYRYRLRAITDNQYDLLVSAAKLDRQREQNKIDSARRKMEQDIATKREDCLNQSPRERALSQCDRTPGWRTTSPQQTLPPLESYIRSRILGPCVEAKTTQAAKSLGCISPNL